MNRERPSSPLSLAFNNFYDERRRRRDSSPVLQHVFIGGREKDRLKQNMKIHNDKQALLLKLKEVNDKHSVVSTQMYNNVARKPPSVLFAENKNSYSSLGKNARSPMKIKTVGSHSIISNAAQTHQGYSNENRKIQEDEVKKQQKAKQDLALKLHSSSSNGISSTTAAQNNFTHHHKETISPMKVVIPDRFVPRSYNDIKKDLLQIHRRQSITSTTIDFGSLTDKKLDEEKAASHMAYQKHYRHRRQRRRKKKSKSSSTIGSSSKHYLHHINHPLVENKVNEDEQYSGDKTDHEDTSSGSSSSNNTSDDDYQMYYNQSSSTSTKMTINNPSNQHQYTKDYIKLAQEYKKMSCYQHGNPKLKKKCFVCKCKAQTKPPPPSLSSFSSYPKASSSMNNKLETGSNQKKQRNTLFLTKVLFPCQHRCICNKCWERNDSSKNNKEWTKCPYCGEDIKFTVDYDGNDDDDINHYGYSKEEDRYWDWINEIKPQLPNGFLKSFSRNSRLAISEAMAKSVMDDNNDENSTDIMNSNEYDEDNKSKNKKAQTNTNSVSSSLKIDDKKGNNTLHNHHQQHQFRHSKQEVHNSKICIIS